MKVASELFSWFKHQSICPDVRALNATIFVHATPSSIIGKGYCVWRSQMSFLVDFNTSWYVLMLERWMLPFTYIQRPTVSLVRDIVHEDHKWVFFSWFKHELIYPDFRALNSTMSVHSTPNSIIGKEYCVWRSQMSFFSLFNHKFICPDVRALNATIFVHSTPNSIIDQG